MKTTNEPTTPAPVWRLLEPGEIIKEGDEFLHFSGTWMPDNLSIGGAVRPGETPVRRRMEPDLVKAELLAALVDAQQALAHALAITEGMQASTRIALAYAEDKARTAIARAKSTT